MYWPDYLPTLTDQLCSIGAKSSYIPCHTLYISLLLYGVDKARVTLKLHFYNEDLGLAWHFQDMLDSSC